MNDLLAPTTRSRVIKSEYRMFPDQGLARVELRFDDTCRNGHNSFGITVNSKAQHEGFFGGCMHDELVKVFPEYEHLIKWHLCSTDGPLHYIANTIYHMECGKTEWARSSAIAPDADEEQLLSKEWLEARLPALLKAFNDQMIATFS